MTATHYGSPTKTRWWTSVVALHAITVFAGLCLWAVAMDDMQYPYPLGYIFFSIVFFVAVWPCASHAKTCWYNPIDTLVVLEDYPETARDHAATITNSALTTAVGLWVSSISTQGNDIVSYAAGLWCACGIFTVVESVITARYAPGRYTWRHTAIHALSWLFPAVTWLAVIDHAGLVILGGLTCANINMWRMNHHEKQHRRKAEEHRRFRPNISVPLDATLRSPRDGWEKSVTEMAHDPELKLSLRAVASTAKGYYYVTEDYENLQFSVELTAPAYGQWTVQTWRAVLEDPTVESVTPLNHDNIGKGTLHYGFSKEMKTLTSADGQWTMTTVEVIEQHKAAIDQAVIDGLVPGDHTPGLIVANYAEWTIEHWRTVTGHADLVHGPQVDRSSNRPDAVTHKPAGDRE